MLAMKEKEREENEFDDNTDAKIIETFEAFNEGNEQEVAEQTNACPHGNGERGLCWGEACNIYKI